MSTLSTTPFRISRRRRPILAGLASGWLLLSPLGAARLAAQTPVLRNPSCRSAVQDGILVLDITGETSLPRGAEIAIAVRGEWPGLKGAMFYEGIPEFKIPVQEPSLRERFEVADELPPGRYVLSAALKILEQSDPAVAVALARRQPPAPISFNLYAGSSGEFIQWLTQQQERIVRWTGVIESMRNELESYIRARQRSTRDEVALKSRMDDLFVEILQVVNSRRPPFQESSDTLRAILHVLLSAVPVPNLDDEGNPSDIDENGRPYDPQTVFGDDRIVQALKNSGDDLPKVRASIRSEFANAILAEIERACRMLAEAYRTSAANPRDWTDAVREAREAADKLLTAASAPEAAALGGKGPNHVALLQAFTSQLEARPPAPPPAEGEAADPKLPADVAEGIENIARALQAARSKLAS